MQASRTRGLPRADMSRISSVASVRSRRGPPCASVWRKAVRIRSETWPQLLLLPPPLDSARLSSCACPAWLPLRFPRLFFFLGCARGSMRVMGLLRPPSYAPASAHASASASGASALWPSPAGRRPRPRHLHTHHPARCSTDRGRMTTQFGKRFDSGRGGGGHRARTTPPAAPCAVFLVGHREQPGAPM